MKMSARSHTGITKQHAGATKIVVFLVLAMTCVWAGDALVPRGVGAATTVNPSELPPLGVLTSGAALSSPNGKFQLVMQTGGNLVESTTGGTVLWQSATSSPGSTVDMQGDGNLVVYSTSTQPLWSSKTAGNAGAFLSLGDLGQLSINTGNGVPFWEPGTYGAGAIFASASSKGLPGEQFRLNMQADGNLVERNLAGTSEWSSGTKSTGAYAVMQTDGNLVVYSAANVALWASNTAMNPGAHLSIGGLGQLDIVAPSGSVLWEPGTMPSGIILSSGATTATPANQFRLTMQSGGNLVETNASGTTLWSSGTSSAGAHAVMQTDGNLVVVSTTAVALWASNTSGNPGATVTINGLGQLVIDSASGVALWGPGMFLGPPGTLPVNGQLTGGQWIMSPALPDGEQFQLTMQTGGNLVEFSVDGSTLWSSGTSSPGARVVVQTDGNLVIYNTANTPLWASNTIGSPGAFLTIGDLGQLTIQSVTGTLLWSSTTAGPGLGVAPSAVSAAAGNGAVADAAAVVSWTAPTPNVWSAPVWGYRVASKPSGITAFVNAPATSATVTGLTDGTSYTFTVQTVNAAGAGLASFPVSNPVTPRPTPVAPGPPKGIEAVPGNGQGTVTWSPPIDTGGYPILDFIVTPAPSGTPVTVGASATSSTVTGLTNGTTYTFKVAAQNSVGVGTSSVPSAPIVPATSPFPAGSTLTGDTSAGDWSMYNDITSASDWNSAETTLSTSTASSLSMAASATGLGTIQSSIPVAAFGHVFVGSNSGYETALNVGSMSQYWSTYLGTDGPVATCPNSSQYGVVSSPTAATVNGTTNVVYLSGGDAALYALNASTGGILWRTQLAALPNNFSFVSPLLYNGALYTGIASYGDCPLVQGQFFKINPLTGAIEATFLMAPNGCIGGGVWGSPSVDSSGHIFFATGTEVQGCTGSAEGVTGWQLETSVDEVDANLNLVGHWHLPEAQQVSDSDFGSVPTIYDDSGVGSGHLVAVGNKDGNIFAFDRQNLAAGPIWQTSTALGGADPSFTGNISPMAYDGTRLYVVGGQATIGTQSCGASLRALNPATGAIMWSDCFASGPAIGPVTGANGVVVACIHNAVVTVNASTGAQLGSVTFPGGVNCYSGASISNGNIFAQNAGGVVLKLTP